MTRAPRPPQPLRAQLRHWLGFALATPLHPQWLAARHHRRRTEWVAQRAGGVVLDVGCAGSTIRAHLRCERYYGLDYPATAVVMYGTRPDVFGDAGALPIAAGSVDTVLLVDVLEHLREPDAALTETARVLKPDGRLLATMPFAYPLHDEPHDYQRWTRHGIAHRLARAGLQPITIDENGGAAEAAAATFCMALAQGGLDALAARRWRVLALPLLPVLVLSVNLAGALAQWLAPTRAFFPASYCIEARRR